MDGDGDEHDVDHEDDQCRGGGGYGAVRTLLNMSMGPRRVLKVSTGLPASLSDSQPAFAISKEQRLYSRGRLLPSCTSGTCRRRDDS